MLAELNRGGYWTDCSQPGEVDGRWQQRAYVSGRGTEATADALRAGLLDSELVVLATPMALETWLQIPISRDGRSEWTWGGGHRGADDVLQSLDGEVGPGRVPYGSPCLDPGQEPALRINVLGPLRIENVPTDQTLSDRQAELLVYLVLHPGCTVP